MVQIMADFETTPKRDDCRVWLWCAVDIDNLKRVWYGETIEEFFDTFKNGQYTIYFHNLKFDGEFLLSYILNVLKFQYAEKPDEHEFRTLISDMGVFYMIECVFSKKNKHVSKITFLDSYKKLPFKVKDIAKAFQLEESKGEIDHSILRPRGYKPTKDELEYVTNDVIIVAKALKMQFEQGLSAMTMSSDGLKYCKHILTEKGWHHYFPVLDIAMDDEIRKSYKGGAVMVHPLRAGVEVYNGHSFDKNSMYPWAMTMPMPWGMPLFFQGKYQKDEQYPLFIQALSCEFKVKEGFLPTIQIKRHELYKQNEYISESIEQTVLYLTSVDLQLFFDHYEVYNIRWLYGYKFKSAIGIFDDYVNHWYEMKKNSTGAKRQIAKLMLNAFYGKTASRTHIRSKIPYLNEEGIVCYKLSEDETKDPVYTAVASFITSYGRDSVIRSAQAVGGSKPDSHFCYMDTDSIHVIGISVEEISKYIEVDSKKLGAWKHEYSFDRAKYIRQKCYIEEIAYKKGTQSYEEYIKKMSGLTPQEQAELKFTEGEDAYYTYVKKCAGMTDNIKSLISYEEFDLGYEIENVKLKPVRCYGGVVLEPTSFKMKP